MGATGKATGVVSITTIAGIGTALATSTVTVTAIAEVIATVIAARRPEINAGASKLRHFSFRVVRRSGAPDLRFAKSYFLLALFIL